MKLPLGAITINCSTHECAADGVMMRASAIKAPAANFCMMDSVGAAFMIFSYKRRECTACVCLVRTFSDGYGVGSAEELLEVLGD